MTRVHQGDITCPKDSLQNDRVAIRLCRTNLSRVFGGAVAMTWPQANEFQDAVQDPQASFMDPELRGAEVVTNALGLPIPSSGQFGVVYHFRSGAEKSWAVKCSTHPSTSRHKRYEAITKRLREAGLPFTIGFDYLEQGIRV